MGAALVIHGALCLISTVARFRGFGHTCLPHDFSVMPMHNFSNTVSAAIADFDGSSVENSVQCIVLWEVFIHELQELVAEICFQSSTVRRVVPGDVPFPPSLSLQVLVLFCGRLVL